MCVCGGGGGGRDGEQSESVGSDDDAGQLVVPEHPTR